MGNAGPIDGRPQSEAQVGPDKLEVVASFCYLSAGGPRLWNIGHYSCENSLEEVQGATTSSHIPKPLLQDWPGQSVFQLHCICADSRPAYYVHQLLRAEHWHEILDQTDHKIMSA